MSFTALKEEAPRPAEAASNLMKVFAGAGYSTRINGDNVLVTRKGEQAEARLQTLFTSNDHSGIRTGTLTSLFVGGKEFTIHTDEDASPLSAQDSAKILKALKFEPKR